MGGFYIYVGLLVDETSLREILEDYSNTRVIELDGEETTLKDNIENFEINNIGTICFKFLWDTQIPHEYRGVTTYSTQTYFLNVRIVRRENNIFYLIEKKSGISPSYLIRQLSTIIYDEDRIGKIILSSDSIKKIEKADVREIKAEWFTKLSDMDTSMGLTGKLETRHKNGSVSRSESHERYMNKPKHYTSFESLSRGVIVYISGKKIVYR